MPLCGVCVCVCVSVTVFVRPCVCLSRSYILSKRINVSSKNFSPSGSQAILVFPHHMVWQYSDGNPPPHQLGVECSWGRQKSRFWAYIWLQCELWTVQAASAIYLAATDHGKFITQVAGRPRSLLMTGNNDELYDNKPQRYAEDTVTHW